MQNCRDPFTVKFLNNHIANVKCCSTIEPIVIVPFVELQSSLILLQWLLSNC